MQINLILWEFFPNLSADVVGANLTSSYVLSFANSFWKIPFVLSTPWKLNNLNHCRIEEFQPQNGCE